MKKFFLNAHYRIRRDIVFPYNFQKNSFLEKGYYLINISWDMDLQLWIIDIVYTIIKYCSNFFNDLKKKKNGHYRSVIGGRAGDEQVDCVTCEPLENVVIKSKKYKDFKINEKVGKTNVKQKLSTHGSVAIMFSHNDLESRELSKSKCTMSFLTPMGVRNITRMRE